MSYGLEIYSSSGTLQANSEMLCWFCRKTGTGTTVSRLSGNTPTSSVSVSVSGLGYTHPIIAINMGGGYSVAKAGSEGHYVSDAPIGTSYTYYIFDYSAALPAETGYGFEAFNASGQKTFSSSYFPMQVLNMLDGNSAVGISNSVTHTGKTLALANASMGGYAIRGDLYCTDAGLSIWDGFTYCNNLVVLNDCKLYGGVLSNSSQTATTSNVSFDDVTITLGNSDNYVLPPDWNTTSKILVIDVTNIPVGQTFY